MTSAVSTAIATTRQPHLVEKYKDDFATVMPTHVNADQWMRLTTGMFRTNEALNRILVKNPGSVLRALMDCAQKGLVVGDTYHLLPFGNEVTGTPDYTGLIELMYRAGEVATVKVEIVYAKDHFVYWPGEMDKPDHKPDWFGGDRGEMIGVYAYGVMHDGSVSQVVIMDKAAVEKVRSVSKTWQRSDSMWKQWPDRAWKKTAIRQLAKFVPTSTEYRKSVVTPVAPPALPVPSPVAQEALGSTTFPSPLRDDDIHDAEIVEPDVVGEVPPAEEEPPPADEPAAQAASPMTKPQQRKMMALFGEKGFTGSEDRHAFITDELKIEVTSSGALTFDQAKTIIEALDKLPAPDPAPSAEVASDGPADGAAQ